MFSLVFLIILIGIGIAWFVSANRRKQKLVSRAQQLTNTAVTEEVRMKEMMLEKMNAELEQSIHTDTIVVVVGIILNIILLGATTGVAAATNNSDAGIAIKLIFFVLIAFIIVLNVSVGYVLLNGKKRRVKVTERLEKFWEDEGLGKYQDVAIGKGYETRGNLFTLITMALGVVTILVPLIMYFFG